MGHIKENIIKNAECDHCKRKLHRHDFYVEITRQAINIHYICPVCRHHDIVETKHRGAANR